MVASQAGAYIFTVESSPREAAMTLWTIRADYDPEAKVWWTSDSEVPGLVAEADTLEQLAEKLEYLVPEMVDANGQFIAPERRQGPHEFRLVAHHELQRPAAA
ncbi:DUF1902 domain-containing protein [Enterovirga sp. GCM10030262]|uniref:DUF1902 domain-containing protein n=1 Tax=Enterovirga sp. GCM10030262 TaxID=3273391 RepID=UPI0036201BF5